MPPFPDLDSQSDALVFSHQKKMAKPAWKRIFCKFLFWMNRIFPLDKNRKKDTSNVSLAECFCSFLAQIIAIKAFTHWQDCLYQCHFSWMRLSGKKSSLDKTSASVAKAQVIRCSVSDRVAASHSGVKIRYMGRAPPQSVGCGFFTYDFCQVITGIHIIVGCVFT